MAKKKESIIEEAKEKAKDVVEKVEEVLEDVEEKTGKALKKAEKTIDKALDEVTGKDEEVKKKPAKTKLEELKEKAKALEKKVKDVEKIDIKERVTGVKSEEAADTLVPVEDYLKSSMHLGTRVITPHMRPFIYKRRADGLAVFNTNLLDKFIREAGDFFAKFDAKDIILVCKREAGWSAVKKFGELLGIRTFMKKYPAGVLTNTNLENFFECGLVIICDPWLDKNALADANRIKIPVLGICDSNNYSFGMNKYIIGNNKSAKSLGMMFYLLAKTYIEKRKLDVPAPKIEDFVDDWENLVPPK